MNLKNLVKTVRLPLAFIGTGYILERYYNFKSKKNDNIINETTNVVNKMVENKELESIQRTFDFSLIRENLSDLDKLVNSKTVIDKVYSKKLLENKFNIEYNNFLDLNLNGELIFSNINDLMSFDFSNWKLFYSILNIEEQKLLASFMELLHKLVISSPDMMITNLDLLISTGVLLCGSSLFYFVLKANADLYLIKVKSLISKKYYDLINDCVNIIGRDNELVNSNNESLNRINKVLEITRSFNSNLYGEQFEELLNKYFYNSETTCNNSNVNVAVQNNITLDNNFNAIIGNNQFMNNEEIQNWILLSEDISRSDISSFIYEIYNLILYIDFNSIYSFINSPDLPFIKFVGIIVLFCTIFILIFWVNILSYCISGSLIEYYKIKDKYPKMYKYISILRKFNFSYLVIEFILMIILYILIFLICFDILIN